MHELPTSEFPRAARLFQPLDYQLATQAVLAGTAQGRVFVDDAARPRSALLWTGHRLYLAGDPGSPRFNADLRAWWTGDLFPGNPHGEYGLYFSTDDWANSLARVILPDHPPVGGAREYYQIETAGGVGAWAAPEGFALRPVDESLIAQAHLAWLDDLLEEMQSERASVEDFLAHSFGAVLIDPNAGQGTLVSWCLSEYNLGGRCEVGIATHPAYRLRGLAAATGAAFVAQARAAGIQTIGWHCWKNNIGSGAAARRIGYALERPYPSAYVIADRLVNLAMQGVTCLNEGRYEQAARWLIKALALGDGPWWVTYRAACAAARLGRLDQAFAYLERSLELGLPDAGFLENSEHLAGLKGDPRWAGLVEKR